MGYSVSDAGDVNGDGYEDVVVGAILFNNGESEEGAAFVFLGSSSGLVGTNPDSATAVFESNQAGAYTGYSVSGAGDVNGDGYADVIVGAYGFDNGETDEGAAFLFLGSSSGLAGTDPATAAAVLESNQQNANMGCSVSGAGDVNGDGYGDLIVGADWFDNGEWCEGAALLFLGSNSGLLGTSLTTAAALLESNQEVAHMGCSVSGAGDVNGDGYADVIVGASDYENGEAMEGAAFLFLGSSSGLLGTSPATAAAVIESDQEDAFLGSSVSDAGDVNGDGYADVVVGVPRYWNGEMCGGAAFLFLGSSSGLLGTSPDTATAVLQSNQDDAFLGSSVSGAGDVNGDGYADVIVGADGYDNGETGEGAAFVFLGSSSGLLGTGPATAAAVLESNQANACLGSSVSDAGDVNGDGYADVIVGAKWFFNGEASEGAAFMFMGSSSGLLGTTPATAAAVIESNQASACPRLFRVWRGGREW